MMRLVGWSLMSLLAQGAAAQDPPSSERSEPPSPESELLTPLPPGTITPTEPDPLFRDQGRMPTDADAGQRPPAPDPMETTGNDAALVRGSATRPGTSAVMPIGARAAMPGATQLSLSAFAVGELAWVIYDGEATGYDTTFRPREVELDVEARFAERGRLRLDLNVITGGPFVSSSPLGALSSPLGGSLGGSFGSALGGSLADQLLEQAFVEVSPGLVTIRAGRMRAPLGAEALDAPDRVTLSRGWLGRLFLPTLLTGAQAELDLSPHVDAYVLVANGWERSLDNNRTKSIGLGVPHRAGPYSGQLGFFFGHERELDATRPGFFELLGDGELDPLLGRAVIDYHGTVQLPLGMSATLELVRGQEHGLGFNTETGVVDPGAVAVWHGGSLWLEARGADCGCDALAPFAAALRLEYLRDKDLSRRIPTAPALPLLTTLFGVTTALRYELADGLSAGLEYRADFARADVTGVSVQRNGDDQDAFPTFWNLRNWFATQEVLLALVAQL